MKTNKKQATNKTDLSLVTSDRLLAELVVRFDAMLFVGLTWRTEERMALKSVASGEESDMADLLNGACEQIEKLYPVES